MWKICSLPREGTTAIRVLNSVLLLISMPVYGAIPTFRPSARTSTLIKHAQWLPVVLLRNCSSVLRQGPPLHTVTQSTSRPITPPADHRVLATDQELFVTSLYSPGSPLFLPNGAHVFNRLLSFLRAQYQQFGFQEVITPTIYKKSLWEKSGHWGNYKDDMFEVNGGGAFGRAEGGKLGEDEEYGLKPMNCPGHCVLFGSQSRAYKDLPIRYADFSPLHRNEVSGALSGLTRVRKFHQDDGHIFCRPSQISEEISLTLEFVSMVYKTFKLPPFKLVLSTRPKDNYIGTVDEWDAAENALREALSRSGRQWGVNEGDGAFYGPKIDVVLKDSDGKEHQTATIQLDFQLPQRFGLKYLSPAPELEKRGISTADPEQMRENGLVTPVVIHRAVFGSLERFMALLIEHCNGHWPFWLSPRQAIILTVGSKTGGETVRDYANLVRRHLSGTIISRDEVDGIRTPQPTEQQTFLVDLDDSGRSLNKKVSEAKRKKYNMIIIVGLNNVREHTVTLDLTGQPDEEGARSYLCKAARGIAIEDLRSVELTSEDLLAYFCLLARAYQ
jgi:threonyl-tRNA synthetase